MPRKTDGLTSLTLRIREDLHRALSRAAKEANQSLNAEIGNRLARSVDDEALLGGDKTAPALRAIAAEIANVEHRTGKSWREDVRTFTAVRETVNRALARFSPPPINRDSLVAAAQSLEESRKKLDAQIEYLRSVGAIEEKPKGILPLLEPVQRGMVGGLLGSYSSAPLGGVLSDYIQQEKLSKEHAAVRDALFEKNHKLLVDLGMDPNSWELADHVDPSTKPAILAMLLGLPAYVADERSKQEAHENAFKPHMAELNAGLDLADEIAGFKVPRHWAQLRTI